jgi:hypothetical protein
MKLPKKKPAPLKVVANLAASDLALFASFRSDNESLRAANVHRVTDAEARREGFVGVGDLSGIVFPYCNEAGVQENARLRRDNPGFDQDGKPGARYLSLPKATYSRLLYWLPGERETLDHPETEYALVEAEKSVLACTAWARRTGRKIVFVGLGGCWGWRDKRPDPKDAKKTVSLPLADLELLRGRKVRLLLDSNVAENPDVLQAERTLTHYLSTELSAQVSRYRVPVEPGVNGPDDYLARHSDEEFAALLERPAPEGVLLVSDPLDVAVERAERLLAASPEHRLFARGVGLVRVAQENRQFQEDATFRRPSGNTHLAPVDAGCLDFALSKGQYVWKVNPRTQTLSRVDPRPQWARQMVSRLLSSPDLVPWKRVSGVAAVPLLLLDGTLVNRPGYHAATGVWYDPQGREFPAIPEKPTREEARAALETFWNVFGEFPFVLPEGCEDAQSSPAYATVLATVLSVLLRHLVPTVPLLAIDASEPGSGKTKVAEAICGATTGRLLPRMTYDNEEEFDKHLPVPLAQGDQIILIDNVERKSVRSARLSAALATEAEVKLRILGLSKDQPCVNHSVFIVTGNQLVISGELPRRTLRCRLVPNVAAPENRKFDFDPVDRTRERFPQLATSALTAARYYLQAGCPVPKYDSGAALESGSFTDWNRVVRGLLVHLGFGDPLATQKEVRAENPMLANDIELAEALYQLFPKGRKFTVKDVKAFYGSDAYNLLTQGPRRDWDAQTAGYRIRNLKDRVLGGVQVVGAGTRGGTALYWVGKVAELQVVTDKYVKPKSEKF